MSDLTCPRCGFPLRRKGRRYYCPRCGYVWEEENDEWSGVIDNIERILEDRVSREGW